MKLTEELLQYLWQNRIFNLNQLQTTEGEPIQILSAGMWNKDAGPDFLNGKIKVGTTTLVGHIELHLKASDWIKHGHSGDPHYKNIILHVVYEADLTHDLALPSNVPTLELKERISHLFLKKYERWMQQEAPILCANQLDEIREITWLNWKDRLLVERWQQKTEIFSQWMKANHHDWSTTFYKALARNFGVPINSEAFVALADALPLKVLAHYKGHLKEMEALLFGQAGFFSNPFMESYPNELRALYQYLRKKHRLQPIQNQLWKWGRMRPSSFPTLRLAQFAAILAQTTHLWSKVLEIKDLSQVKTLFQIEVSPYWENHYRFDKISKEKKKPIGHQMINNLLINTLCPMLAYYDQFQLSGKYLERAFDWMKALPKENNRYTREWEKVGEPHSSAWDSQAFIQLFKYYCVEKRCLECAIGHQLLR